MFTFSGLILETRENLFRDFWSQFSISFYFSSERNLKKTRNRLWAVLGQDTAGRGLYKAPPQRESPAAQPRNPNPSRRRHRLAADSPEQRAARGSPPPRFPCRFNFFCSSFFFFVGIFRGYFLIAISDPIFVLV